jgi:thiamine biosynthesis lipoprotein
LERSRRSFLTFNPSPEPVAGADYWIRVHRRAMACRFEITLSGEDGEHVPAARAALDEVDGVEDHLTVFRETSRLSELNRRAAREPVAVDDTLFALLAECRDLHERTEGAFDITSTPLSRCWGFLRRAGRVPTPAEIAQARKAVGMEHVELAAEGRHVRFRRAGLELNLGAVGKGYSLDRAASVLRARGVSHALLSAAGSSVLALGGRGDDWTIDVGSRQLGRRVGRLRLQDGALGTSGAGVQFIEAEGKRYGHVIDPRTGWPAEGTAAATVVTRRAAVADALSTAFLVGGPGLAERYCAGHLETLAILTTEDGQTHAFGTYPGALFEKETDACI